MPLAHILAPQITQKVRQIEADLGRAPPSGYLNRQKYDVEIGAPQMQKYDVEIGAPQMQKYDVEVGAPQMSTPAGYLQSNGNIGSGATAGAGMPLPKMQAGETAADAAKRELGAMPAKRPDQVVRDAAIASAMKQDKLQAGTRLLPNAPAPQSPAPAPKKNGKVVIPLGKPGEPVAVNERGQSLDSRGRNLGYLNQDPNLRLPTNDQMNPYETGGAKMIERIPGMEPVVERRYRKHLEAMQNNRDEQGMPTDELPPGYFEALGHERGRAYSKDEQQDILNGIQALRKIDKGVSI